MLCQYINIFPDAYLSTYLPTYLPTYSPMNRSVRLSVCAAVAVVPARELLRGGALLCGLGGALRPLEPLDRRRHGTRHGPVQRARARLLPRAEVPRGVEDLHRGGSLEHDPLCLVRGTAAGGVGVVVCMMVVCSAALCWWAPRSLGI